MREILSACGNNSQRITIRLHPHNDLLGFRCSELRNCRGGGLPGYQTKIQRAPHKGYCARRSNRWRRLTWHNSECSSRKERHVTRVLLRAGPGAGDRLRMGQYVWYRNNGKKGGPRSMERQPWVEKAAPNGNIFYLIATECALVISNTCFCMPHA